MVGWSYLDSDRLTFRLAINSKCDEILKWIDANQLAKANEFQDKQKEAEGIFNPVITGARSRTKVIELKCC